MQGTNHYLFPSGRPDGVHNPEPASRNATTRHIKGNYLMAAFPSNSSLEVFRKMK